MIHYALRCGADHAFDGWFRSSAAFDQQAAGGLLDCPVCASTQVRRAIMSPRISGTGVAPAEPEAQPPKAVTTEVAVAGPPAMPDQMRAVLQRIRAEVEERCDYVGPRFAETARAMHAGTTPPRPIYGETTPDQADALAEDGIEVARIPWVPRADG